jgi:hypothetical protein
VVAVEDNKKVASMLYKFAHAFLAIGIVLVIAFSALVGWDLHNMGLLTGIGFMLGSLFIYTIATVLNAVFSFEKNLKAVKQQLNENNVRPLWK